MTTIATPKNIREKLLCSLTGAAFAPAVVSEVETKSIKELYADNVKQLARMKIPKKPEMEHLLEKRLKKLCDQWGIDYELTEPKTLNSPMRRSKTSSIIEYFSYSLSCKDIKGAVGAENYRFYQQTQNNFERFIVHLQNENLPIEDRKTHLREIIQGMDLCATGVLNKLYESNAHFETSYTLPSLLADCRLIMVKECASEAARQYNKNDAGSKSDDDSLMALYEIHFQQRFFKYAVAVNFDLGLPNIKKLAQEYTDHFDRGLNRFYRENENGVKVFFGSTNREVNNTNEAICFFYETFRKKYTLQGIMESLLAMAEKYIADLGIMDVEFDMADFSKGGGAEKFTKIISKSFFKQEDSEGKENWRFFFVETYKDSGVYKLTDRARLVYYLAPKLSILNVEKVFTIAKMTLDNYLETSKRDLEKHILGNSEEDDAYLTEYLAKMTLLFPESIARQQKLNEVFEQASVSKKEISINLRKAIEEQKFAKFELLMDSGFILKQEDYKALMIGNVHPRLVERAARAYYQDKLKKMTAENCLNFYDKFFLVKIGSNHPLFSCYLENMVAYFLKIKQLIPNDETRLEKINAYLNKREKKKISLSAYLKDAVKNNDINLIKIEFLLCVGVVPTCKDFVALNQHTALNISSKEAFEKVKQNYCDSILAEIRNNRHEHVKKFLALFPKEMDLTDSFVEPYLATMRKLFPDKKEFESQLQLAFKTKWGDISQQQTALNDAIQKSKRPIHNKSKVDLLVAAGVDLTDNQYKKLRQQHSSEQEKNDSELSRSLEGDLFNKAAKTYSRKKLKTTLETCATLKNKAERLQMIKACVAVISKQDPISKALAKYVEYRTGGFWGWLFGSISSKRYQDMLNVLKMAEKKEFECVDEKELKGCINGTMTLFKKGRSGTSRLRNSVCDQLKSHGIDPISPRQ